MHLNSGEVGMEEIYLELPLGPSLKETIVPKHHSLSRQKPYWPKEEIRHFVSDSIRQ